MTVTIALDAAPRFIAGLVKQGLKFNATQNDDGQLVIEFTGGY